jgi:hypothetical protein
MREGKMRQFITATVVVAAIAVSGAAFAYPTLQGPTGLVTLPTVDLVPYRQFDAAYDYAKQGDLTLHLFRFVYGASETAEIYGTWGSVDNQDVDNTFTLGGKFLLPKSYGMGGKWALGGDWQQLSDSVRVKVMRAYLTGSFDITKGRVHAGLMFIDADVEGAGSQSAIRPFIGAELSMPNADTLGAELRFRASDIEQKTLFSVVYRHSFPNSKWAGELGFTNGAALGLGGDNTEFFVGAKGRFGGV